MGTFVTVPATLKLRRDSLVDFEVPEKLLSRAPLSPLTRMNRTGLKRGSSGGAALSQAVNIVLSAHNAIENCLIDGMSVSAVCQVTPNLVSDCLALIGR